MRGRKGRWNEGDLFEQFTHAVQCVGQLERVTEVKHRVGVCVCFYMNVSY